MIKLLYSLFLIPIGLYLNEYTSPSGDIWMSHNLSVQSYRNGDTLFHAKTEEQWQYAFKNRIPAYCYFRNKNYQSNQQGALYNFYALKDERELAPEGWHVPTDQEWTALINNNGGINNAADTLMRNQFNFQPGSIRDINGEFIEMDSSSVFWTSTIDFNFLSYNRQLNLRKGEPITRGSSHHAMGLYVRCVKDK